MLTKKNIICISSIDWDFVWQGHQEIMSTFAKNGNKILFIENTGIRSPRFTDVLRLKKRINNWLKSTKGFRKELDNLYVYSPIILPFPYSKIARFINKLMLLKALNNWMKIMEFHDPIIWTFLPTGITLDIVNNISYKVLVYYCIADFYQLTGHSKKLKKIETELIRKCDMVFAQGKELQDKCLKYNKNVHVFPFGVNIDYFKNFKYSAAEVPGEIKNIKKPLIGYIGGVHRHIDFEILKFIAGKHPDWSIVMVGPLQVDISGLSCFKNIRFLGQKNFRNLANYIYEFDVCVIPYMIDDYTKTVYPTKLNEYLAMGKKVVSTELPEVVKFNNENNNLIMIAKDKEDFLKSLEGSFMEEDPVLKEKRVISASNNNWSTRIDKMSDLIQETMDKKLFTLSNWKENLLKVYKKTRRRFQFLAVLIVSIYLLVFYTPLMWIVADPLKISNSLTNVDCIVVFAGGVGESGQAGQGYEERVRYAVELYKKGYANKLLFSSGYMFAFKEPLVMRALAVSLGVPEKLIILEDRAVNTYQNVSFTKEIIETNNFNKIMLISSPYHMLRVSFVFKKKAGNLEVIYAPIEDSIFYDHSEKDKTRKIFYKQINLRQLKAIIHEYLGIVYYWWKGYI